MPLVSTGNAEARAAFFGYEQGDYNAQDECANPNLGAAQAGQVRDVLRLNHYSARTEEAYAGWIRRFILYHGKKHPREMGAVEVEMFLTHLAVGENVSTSTQKQALNALVFFYHRVL